MLLEAVVVGTIVGLLRGGRLKYLGLWQFKRPSILLSALMIQNIAFLATAQQLLKQWTFFLIYVSYLLILISLTLNFKNRYLQGIFVGTAFNFITIIANGAMPVESRFMYAWFGEKVQLSYDVLHVPASESTRFWYLGDFIPIPPTYPLSGLISPGDIVLMISVFLLIQNILLKPPPQDQLTGKG